MTKQQHETRLWESFSYRLPDDLLEEILDKGARRATKYISEKPIVRATRRSFKRAKGIRSRVEVLFTIGEPNYRERKFIKACKKDGKPLVSLGIQLNFGKNV